MLVARVRSFWRLFPSFSGVVRCACYLLLGVSLACSFALLPSKHLRRLQFRPQSNCGLSSTESCHRRRFEVHCELVDLGLHRRWAAVLRAGRTRLRRCHAWAVATFVAARSCIVLFLCPEQSSLPCATWPCQLVLPIQIRLAVPLTLRQATVYYCGSHSRPGIQAGASRLAAGQSG